MMLAAVFNITVNGGGNRKGLMAMKGEEVQGWEMSCAMEF